MLHRESDHRLDIGFRADIRGNEGGPGAALGRDGFAFFHLHIGDHDTSALAHETANRSCPHAARTAGNNRHLAVQPGHKRPLCAAVVAVYDGLLSRQHSTASMRHAGTSLGEADSGYRVRSSPRR